MAVSCRRVTAQRTYLILMMSLIIFFALATYKLHTNNFTIKHTKYVASLFILERVLISTNASPSTHAFNTQRHYYLKKL